ncbi:FaeA/PapI family transcriptional regulator [Escherichia albertii]|uniref:FaeA/PapI family transcriptional regulator n=1 Tax=Escherichia albertii TaxID=208962 RepID=UPI001FC9E26F|nr:FaeA/PapI family transcriptional regulator [Escherichia albertii]
MSSSEDNCEKIVRFMKECNASLIPLKTKDVADGCGISVYAALYYLRKLNQQNIVEPDRNGKGMTIYWCLVN